MITNIDVFNETIKIINTNECLNVETKKAINNTVIYDEEFQSIKQPDCQSNVRFEENLTLLAAEPMALNKKVAVLNFANPVEPGGGVLRGANSQEEYLCRASNLYPCLTSTQAKPYYELHNNLLKQNNTPYFLSTDRIIYSKNITVIRKDVGFFVDRPDCRSIQRFSNNWYQIDVITCAAPYFYNNIPISEALLKELLKKRIKNIFEVAIENEIQVLILGAFGCGAFHNPPMLVATAFSDVLLESRYTNAFEEVIFAVKRTGFFCENIEAFEITFSVFPPTGEYVLSAERNKRRFFE